MAEDTPPERLARECRVFVRHLLDQEASRDVIASYQQAHAVGVVVPNGPLALLDRALLNMANRGPRFTRLADSYAAVFARGSVLRRKLVLLVAILESRGQTAEAVDTVNGSSFIAWFAASGARGVISLSVACALALLMLPLRLRHFSSRASLPHD